jgi:protease-4
MTEHGERETGWERHALERLAGAALQEQRRARYWGIFFKSVTLLYLFLLLFVAMGWLGARDIAASGRHTALVQVSGVIGPESRASADQIMAGLQAAFKDSNTAGVIIRINSPGGSPVQAGQINDEIRRLRALHPDIPVHAVIEDVCASGGYYVAAAADRIYVNRASLVGSIGVLMDGFGFAGAINRLGVERRLITAGDNKGFLDPFSPLQPRQREHAQSMLNQIHEQFIAVVKQGRGDRLKPVPELFSGLVWTGERSIELGLADALGSVESVARDVIKAETVVDFTPRENIAERFAKRFGAAAMESVWALAGGGRPMQLR